MKRFLLILLCFFLFTSCSSVLKTNTLIGVGVDQKEIEVLPVTADLVVSEQKTRGEATGNAANLDILAKEALAKALGQESPSVDRPDVLVGLVAFTESNGPNLKVIFTGYPAYYTNFRTATDADSLRLNTVNTSSFFDRSEKTPENKSSLYGTVNYLFGEGFGWGLGFGNIWSNGAFLGLEGFQGGLIDDEDIYGGGGGVTIGGIYDLPYQLKLVFGSSVGFWIMFYNDDYYDDPYGHFDHDNEDMYFLSPFLKLRWHGLEVGLRMFTIPDSDLYFSIGYTF